MEKLSLKGISKSFDDKLTIEDISLTVEKNKIVSLLGVSGVGKTTLFNVVAGIDKPDCGEIFLDGVDITGMPGHISYMPQNHLLLPYKTIVDNVSLPLIIKGASKKEARNKALKYFALFKLNGSENKYPREISGGMKQRAALLRTYLNASSFSLLDEPFCALDAITKLEMYKWYMDVSRKISLSTLFITHDIDEALILSDKIYIISGVPGKISGVIVPDKSNTTDDFLVTDEFIHYKKQILKMLGVL